MNRAEMVGLLAALATSAMASIDDGALWSFNDPAASEVRFRTAVADSRDDDAPRAAAWWAEAESVCNGRRP
jgi:hypothetical protein